MNNKRPIALTIAGSDCSAGAGIQADLKTFLQHGVHGLSAVTSVVAESPLEVRQVSPVSVPLLQDQIQILLETYPVDVIKIGLLPTRAIVIAIAEILKNSSIPSVIDPVMVASAGSSLADDEAAQALCYRLLGEATLVTPNMPEASVILNRAISKVEDLEPAAKEIAERYSTSCLIKGGHLSGNAERLDVLWHDGKAHHFRHPAADLPDGIHGTGCTLSSAIAANMALDQATELAVESGINYVQKLIANSYAWEKQGQPVHCLGW
ncbi:MAG: bifunctional hydroxymethylpyrimidine kinase/phosphomethylpyrimidine kinase [Akkermansiaceae bacterium]